MPRGYKVRFLHACLARVSSALSRGAVNTVARGEGPAGESRTRMGPPEAVCFLPGGSLVGDRGLRPQRQAAMLQTRVLVRSLLSPNSTCEQMSKDSAGGGAGACVLGAGEGCRRCGPGAAGWRGVRRGGLGEASVRKRHLW